MSLLLENILPPIQSVGLNTNKTVTLGGALTVSGLATFAGGTSVSGNTIRTYTPTAVNSSATLTAAQLQAGYITSTSAGVVTMTMPSGTSLGGSLGAVQGTTLEFYIDNTAGANTVTVAVGTNAVQSDWDLQVTAATASVTPAAITPLTTRSGVAGISRYVIVFSSPTAYVFSRMS